MNTIKDRIGEILIVCSSWIYDLTSGWLSGEEDAPECISHDKKKHGTEE